MLKSVTYLPKPRGDVEISSSLRGIIHWFMWMDAGMVVGVGVFMTVGMELYVHTLGWDVPMLGVVM